MSSSNGQPGKLPLSLGQVVATPAALDAFSEAGETPLPYLIRHSSGDWGEVDAEDAASNDDAVLNHYRVLSAYTLSSGVKFWIITEWDRSVTTVLLPSDY